MVIAGCNMAQVSPIRTSDIRHCNNVHIRNFPYFLRNMPSTLVVNKNLVEYFRFIAHPIKVFITTRNHKVGRFRTRFWGHRKWEKWLFLLGKFANQTCLAEGKKKKKRKKPRGKQHQNSVLPAEPPSKKLPSSKKVFFDDGVA